MRAGLSRILQRRSSWISGSCVFFITGIMVPLLVPQLFTNTPILFLYGTSLFFITSAIAAYQMKSLPRHTVWTLLFLACFALGLWRTNVVLHAFTYSKESPSGLWRGTVISTRETQYQSYSLSKAVVAIPHIPGGHIQVLLDQKQVFVRGDGVQFTCTLERLALKNAARGAWYECKKPKNLLQYPEATSRLRHAIAWPMYFFEKSIYRVMPAAAGPFTAGILLGIDDRITAAAKNDFRATGTGHIFALSGFNITIITLAIAGVLAWIRAKPQARFLLIAILISFFILATGAASSSVRAGIMGIVILLGRHVGRITRIRILIPLAASCMLLINPLALRYDIGFQLSFLATIGIMLLGHDLKQRLHRLPDTFAIRETTAATLSATIATAPLLVTLGNSVGPVTILANIIIGPIIPVAMLTGFGGTILGGLIPPLAPAIGFIAAIPARAILDTASVLAHW